MLQVCLGCVIQAFFQKNGHSGIEQNFHKRKSFSGKKLKNVRKWSFFACKMILNLLESN
jgi:hypothetical protein